MQSRLPAPPRHPAPATASLAWVRARVGRCAAAKQRPKQRSVEGLLSELQALAAAAVTQRVPAQQQQQRRRRQSPADGRHPPAAAPPVPASTTGKLLARVAAQISGMSTRQLCRLAFLLARLQHTANVRPLWQALLRKLTQGGTQSLLLKLQQEASPGDVLFLLRGLAAWQEPEDLQAAAGQAATVTAAHTAAGCEGTLLAHAVAAASSKAADMRLQELMLSAVTLAQLRYVDRHILQTASDSFVAGVAAACCSSSPQQGSAAGALPTPPLSSGRPADAPDILPSVREVSLLVNFLWANASLAHRQPQLLPAALQLMQQQQLVPRIPRSHLALCMWALAALLVVGHLSDPYASSTATPVSDAGAGDSTHQAVQQHEQPEQQALLSAVQAAHSVLVDQAVQLWQDDTLPAFSTDSRRQMHQAHVWLAAAADSQQQPQQQPDSPPTGPGADSPLAASFWHHCAAAWATNTPTVSHLQAQVLAELQSLQCSPCLEFAAQQLTPAALPGVVQQLERAASRQAGAVPHSSNTMLSIDIACVMPRLLLLSVQQQGLAHVVSAARASSSSSGPLETAPEARGRAAEASLPVAVEVDGPSHVAVNDPLHELGATVCRDWLLQRWGWALVKVAWWQWQA